jgi:hypothetical protein
VKAREGQHDPRVTVHVDEPAEDGRGAADPDPEGGRHQAGTRERAGLGAHEQDHGEAVDADRHAREDCRAQ